MSLTDSAGIRERERERGTEGGSESERLGWHSRFANENEGRREEVSLNDSLNDSPLPETRLNERTNDSLNDSPLPETRLNERTNERTNDSFW